MVQYGEAIPHFQSCPNLAEGMNFPNFEIAIHYCTEFGCFNGFAVRKKRVEKNSSGGIRSRCGRQSVEKGEIQNFIKFWLLS